MCMCIYIYIYNIDSSTPSPPPPSPPPSRPPIVSPHLVIPPPTRGTAWALSLRVEWLGGLVWAFFQWLCLVIIPLPPVERLGLKLPSSDTLPFFVSL